MKILLIAGGWSSERQISLNGAKNVMAALQNLGHNVELFDLTPENFSELNVKAQANDFAFINLHGAPGEDGLIQALLDRVSCPYQGSDATASFLALHKAAAKQLFKTFGLPTPSWEFLPLPPAQDWTPSLPSPWFVKSNTGGSSLHLGKANTLAELNNYLSEIFKVGEEAIIETAQPGKDLTCGVLVNQALPPVLILPEAGEFFDYESKYAKNGAKELCPAPIDSAILAKAQKMALQAHDILGLSGYSRTDFILGENGELSILEVNTLPGMTETSLLPQEAAAIGIDFPQLLQILIDAGLERHTQ